MSVPAPAKVKAGAARAPLLLRKCACGTGAAGTCEACREKEEKKAPLQRSAAGPATAAVPSIVHSALQSPGRPLDPATRSFMEPRFGHDFSRVLIHTDALAAESAHAVNAHAYTVGDHIAFGHGQYHPETPHGKLLLAHELAHTVQQRGLQCSSDGLSIGGPHEARLEHEAEAAARAVAGNSGPIALAARAQRPVLSRAPKNASGAAGDLRKALEDKDAEEVPPEKGVEPGVARFNILTPFPLPGKKGPLAEKVWQDKAKGGGLEAVVDVVKDKAALKQERLPTTELRNIWLTSVGWSKDEAAENWQEAKTLAGIKEKKSAAVSFDPPQVAGETCEMDHIIELQIGGTNIKENMQALGKSQNASSGSQVRTRIQDKADEIISVYPKSAKIRQVILHYRKVDVEGAVECDDCCAVQKVAAKVVGKHKTAALGTGAAEDTKPYPISAGGSETNLLVPTSTEETAIPIHSSNIPENQSASYLISGLILLALNRSKKKRAGDFIDACIDAKGCTGEETKTRLPITLKKAGGVKLLVKSGGKLTLADKTPNLEFTYPYLSSGKITKFKADLAGGISGEGYIQPSVSFLPRLNIRFGPGEFVITSGLDPKKFKQLLPGIKITKAQVELALFPEFKPSGTIEILAGTESRKILEGTGTVGKDEQGLAATFTVRALLPGVEKAEGTVKYSGGEWTGGVTVDTGQMNLPFVKRGVLTVGFSKKGVDPQGTVDLEIPGGHTATLSIKRAGNRWLFTGKGVFKVPRLEPMHVYIEYDGEDLVANGKTKFKLLGFTGNIDATFHAKRSGRWFITGTGTLEFKKGKAEGVLTVRLNPNGKFSGSGLLKYQITESLLATAGAELDEKEVLTFSGELLITKPIKLFGKFGDDKEFFRTGISIPIPGASIGPIGLKVRIEGYLGARYGIGPAELQNTRIRADFKPLEENPDIHVIFVSLLAIPAFAEIYGGISGRLEIDILIASVSGGINVEASAGLHGGFFNQLRVEYWKGRYVVDNVAKLEAGLVLGLALTADAKAEAGIGPFKVTTKKVWKLASYKIDTGLKFGLSAPFHYASDEPFRAPSLDDVQIQTPKVDASDLLSRIFNRARSEETED